MSEAEEWFSYKHGMFHARLIAQRSVDLTVSYFSFPPIFVSTKLAKRRINNYNNKYKYNNYE